MAYFRGHLQISFFQGMSSVLNTSLFAICKCQYLLQCVCKYVAALSEGVHVKL
jgi:hypothetical protein